MCVNNLSKVALDSAAAGIEPTTSSRKSNALTTAPPSHTIIIIIIRNLYSAIMPLGGYRGAEADTEAL